MPNTLVSTWKICAPGGSSRTQPQSSSTRARSIALTLRREVCEWVRGRAMQRSAGASVREALHCRHEIGIRKGFGQEQICAGLDGTIAVFPLAFGCQHQDG